VGVVPGDPAQSELTFVTILPRLIFINVHFCGLTNALRLTHDRIALSC